MTPRTLLALALIVASAPTFAADVTTDASQMVIPVAGSARGARGETFVTDLTLVNLSPAQHEVELTWLPHGGTSSPLRTTVTLQSFHFREILDVAHFLGVDGLGAIAIRAAGGDAALDAHARVWTEGLCSGLGGTVSQSVPALAIDGWRNGSPAYVHGVRQSESFRANYGIVNLDSQPRPFRILVNSPTGRVEEFVTVAAFGTLQRAVPRSAQGSLSVYFEPQTPAGVWRAYATSTDNASGSGWTIPAIQPREDVKFEGGAVRQ